MGGKGVKTHIKYTQMSLMRERQKRIRSQLIAGVSSKKISYIIIKCKKAKSKNSQL